MPGCGYILSCSDFLPDFKYIICLLVDPKCTILHGADRLYNKLLVPRLAFLITPWWSLNNTWLHNTYHKQIYLHLIYMSQEGSSLASPKRVIYKLFHRLCSGDTYKDCSRTQITIRLGQANQTSRFDRDSPGLDRDVPVSRKGTFGTHLCPSSQKAFPVWTDSRASLVTFLFLVFYKRNCQHKPSKE